MYQAVRRWLKLAESSLAQRFGRSRPVVVPIPVVDQARYRSPRRSTRMMVVLATLMASDAALAQSRIRDFTEPQLVHNTDGHHAPIRALIFTDATGSTLLSAGRDKVVHQWNLAGPDLSPTRTLRPPIWRGRRGQIRAMALSPVADAQGQRILAVGGFGIAYNSADIVLFRYPGLDLAGQKTGDLIAHLPVAEINAPEAGHRDGVIALAFSPDGTRLASASLDGTVRVWDHAQRATVAVLGGHSGGVMGLAWPAANQLITGDAGGNVRVWEILPAPRETARVNIAFNEAPNPLLHTVKALAATSDARWVVVGDGKGSVTRFGLPGLVAPLQFLPRADQGSVEALAVAGNGTRLAVAHNARTPADLPPDFTNRSASVELRSFPDGDALGTIAKHDELVTALAFTPDQKTLVYAGGSSNAIHVLPIDPPAASPVKVLRGHGSSLREIGFAPEGLGLAVSRTRISGQEPMPDEWEGFDLMERRTQSYPTATLIRSVTNLEGWTVQQTGPTSLSIQGPNAPVQVLSLNPTVDGSVWCATLLAPRNAGGSPLLAVGCTAGVAIYRITPALQRTRFFAGHEGEVLTIAASRDGKWLATGSNDQTARLWSLVDADKVPTMGAVLEAAPNGEFRFQTVERGGFVDAMGVTVGDVLKTAMIDGKSVPFTDFMAQADAAIPAPDRNIMVTVLKEGPGAPETRTLSVQTSKRQSAAVSLFLADRPAGEWVLWTPAGFYDSSIGGDGKYLGWHLNQSTRIDQPKTTLHYPVGRFRDQFQQPDLLRALLVSGDEKVLIREVAQRALAEPAVIVLGNRPPQLGATIARVGDNLGRIRLQASTLSGAFLRQIQLSKGAQTLPAVPIAANPARVDQELDIALEPGINRIGVAVADDQGRVETQWVEVESPAAPRPTRLWAVAHGADQLGAGLPLIPHAERDARDLTAFLVDRLLDPATGSRISNGQTTQAVLAGSQATSTELTKELDELKARLEKGDMKAGDLLVLSSSAQLVVVNKTLYLAGADVLGLNPPKPAIAAQELAERLGRFARARVGVVLVLDLVHTELSSPEARLVSEWIRGLRDGQGVTVIVASEARRPSEPRVVAGRVSYPTIQHRLLTQGILNTPSANASRRVRIDSQGRLTLDAFHLTVNDSVRELTRGRQLTGCYIPDAVSPNQLFLDAQPR